MTGRQWEIPAWQLLAGAVAMIGGGMGAGLVTRSWAASACFLGGLILMGLAGTWLCLIDDAAAKAAGPWLVGRHEDGEDGLAFIAELGGDICLVDDLTWVQADRICRAHNRALGKRA